MSERSYCMYPVPRLGLDEHMKASRRNDDAVNEDIYRCLKEGVPRLDDLRVQKEIIKTLSQP